MSLSSKTPIIISMCSVPSRADYLVKSIEILKNQADKIFIYLDKYDDIPDTLLKVKNLIILRSQNYKIDYRDHAKFLIFNKLKKDIKNFYFITCDDDIIYPNDYVNTLINNLSSYNDDIAVGIHGIICHENPKHYYKDRMATFLFSKELASSQLVNILGTGTLAFHSKLFDSIDPDQWGNGGMADIFFALKAKDNNIPFLCLQRSEDWLKFIKTENNLYQEFKKKDEIIYQKIKNKKLGYFAIMQILLMQNLEIIDKLRKFLPKSFN